MNQPKCNDDRLLRTSDGFQCKTASKSAIKSIRIIELPKEEEI